MTTTAIPPALAPAEDDPLQAALNDPATGEKLVRHARALAGRHTARRLDADDLVQTTKLRALQSRDRFDPARREVGGWLYGILANVVREEVRKTQKLPAQQPDDRAAWERMVPAVPRADGDMADCRFAVERHLAKLAPTDRAIVKMRCLEDRDHDDIAKQLNLSATTVRMRFRRAMIELKGHATSEGEGRS